MQKYRSNVAAILQDPEGRILIGERSDVSGSWQFPQGGLIKGESAFEGLFREIDEELAIKPETYQILESRGPYRYLFAKGKVKEGYHGQEQHYFLCLFHGDKSLILNAPTSDEFRAVRWIQPKDYRLEWLAVMKHEVYRQVFLDFFAIDLK
ncbi:MAG: NUDIX domain-containing protein [Chthoniobacterales bacterium]